MKGKLLPVCTVKTNNSFFQNNGFQPISTFKNLTLLTNMPIVIFGNMGRLVLKMNAMAAKGTCEEMKSRAIILASFCFVSGPQYQFPQIFNYFLDKKSLLQTSRYPCPPSSQKFLNKKQPHNNNRFLCTKTQMSTFY